MNDFKQAWKTDNPDWIKQRENNWPVFHKYFIEKVSDVSDYKDPQLYIDRVQHYYISGELLKYEGGPRPDVMDLLWLHPAITIESARYFMDWYKQTHH